MKINFKCRLHLKKIFRTLPFWLAFSCLICSPGAWGSNADDQYKVQTAFIYQFTNYIVWPQEADKDFFVISILGASPLARKLEELAKTRAIKGRKMSIQQIAETSQLKKSDIVIIASNSEKVLEEVSKKIKGTGTLVISSTKGFAEKGSMINFYVEEGRIRFEINRTSLENEKLQASSQLLKLAKIVE